MLLSFFVALASSMLIVGGTLYSYQNMINRRIENADLDDDKDIIDMMDDPYDLYDDERQNEVADIKEMIKEEKARQRQNIIKNTAQNSSAWVSLYRFVPYAFLILGFIALEKNHTLNLFPYLAGLAIGVISGYFVAKKLLIK